MIKASILTHIAAVVALTALCVPTVAAQRGWRTYVNPRFGYSVCFPDEFREVGRPPENGDGRVFGNGTGAELRVWGMYNSLEDTIDSAAERWRGNLEDDGVKVTYAAKGRDWLVLSGRQGPRIVYERARLSRGRFISFMLSYPAAAASRWNAAIPKIAACLRDTRQ